MWYVMRVFHALLTMIIIPAGSNTRPLCGVRNSEQNPYPKGQNSVILRPLAAEIGILRILVLLPLNGLNG